MRKLVVLQNENKIRIISREEAFKRAERIKKENELLYGVPPTGVLV
ncbi:hypothetical protein [Pyrococcus abyssi]|uniref:Uncharacterized protein n=1 Tax=Pyrococcus abyssi (strain GE5 / Orsay) TaxID=272844 RepID=G8ZH43_PYRAB|nr:hypothetical protein [Pyrococcus abyssi]CCE70238.1 TPA: hypothetical protein PAB1804.1n [Pyrococcus abyssi GE5]